MVFTCFHQTTESKPGFSKGSDDFCPQDLRSSQGRNGAFIDTVELRNLAAVQCQHRVLIIHINNIMIHINILRDDKHINQTYRIYQSNISICLSVYLSIYPSRFAAPRPTFHLRSLRPFLRCSGWVPRQSPAGDLDLLGLQPHRLQSCRRYKGYKQSLQMIQIEPIQTIIYNNT